MSTTAASSNTNEPPSLFSSLPNDLVLNVLARVPRRYHPILSCVSNNFRSLVNSSELRKTRSLLGKDCFYVCYKEIYVTSTYHWFTLTDNRLVSVPFSSPPEPEPFSALMVGPEIYLFSSGDSHQYSSRMWILDSRSGKLREGPSRRVARYFPAVGLVDGKIYTFGISKDEDEEIQAEVFDTKTQTWDVAPNPNLERECIRISVASPSLDRKIYATNYRGQVIVYDPRDGKYEKIDTPIFPNYSQNIDVCVIDNVLYSYRGGFGLIWYDSKEKIWRVVNGLKLNEDSTKKVVMSEYNGKLAFLWEHGREKNNKEIWCAMIALDRSGVEITGKVEWFDHVLSVPYEYRIKHILGCTD